MAVGKNKGLHRGGKKGIKKKVSDPFVRKNWYDVKVPCMFSKKVVCKTPVNRTQGTKIETESLKQRVFELSLAELKQEKDAELTYQKFHLIAEHIQGRYIYTNFYGMELSSDKLKSMVNKWQTLIEAWVDAKTIDGYALRVFGIAFTSKNITSVKKTCYAQHNQVVKIRRRMTEKMADAVKNNTIKTFVNLLKTNDIGKDIETICSGVFPLHDSYIKKVKVMKRPRFDLLKLLELYQEENDEAEIIGKGIPRTNAYEPPVLDAV